MLFVWLIKPIGNPCPDLGQLPQGSTRHSSPSFSPPGTRTCEYTAAGGIKATSKYVPYIDWIVLPLVAAVAAGGARLLSPSARGAGAPPREPRPRLRSRVPARPEPAANAEGPRPPRAPHALPSTSRRTAGERDAAERERARLERAERARRDR